MRVISIVFLTFLLTTELAVAKDGPQVVREFVNAFNKRDIGAMLDLAAPDLKWMSISGDSISVESSTHAELRKAMRSYFDSTPNTRSKIRHLHESGSFIYALEGVFWEKEGVEKSQCGMAVYELNREKLQRVWYFPSHKC